MINMELQKSNSQDGKFRKFVPRKAVNEGWHYYKLHETNLMVGVRVTVDEIFVITEKGGEPIINPNTKLPILEWDNQKTETKLLTREMYDQIIKSGFEEE